MASRLMHIANAYILEKELKVNDVINFRVGHLLPDAVISCDKKKVNTHFISNINNGSRKMFDFTAFYNRYKHKILTDNLYLGYYFHLIQDSMFRMFLYYNMDYLKYRGNAAFQTQLYNDYHILNKYLVDKYSIKNDFIVQYDFCKHDINEIYPFEIIEFIKDINSDFNDKAVGEAKLFTKGNLDEYISKSLSICIQEYNSICEDKTLLNSRDFSWEIQLGT